MFFSFAGNKRIIFPIVAVLVTGLVIWQLIGRQKTADQPAIQAEQKAGATTIIVPPGLNQCNPELTQLDCATIEEKAVCGYDHTIYESGKERDNVFQYKSACHYCNFYGLDEKNIGGTKIRGLGYEDKPCSQGMYEK